MGIKSIFVSTELREWEDDHLNLLLKVLEDIGFEVLCPAREVAAPDKNPENSVEAAGDFLKLQREKIEEADYVIVDGSGGAANVALEIGIGLALGKPVIIASSGYEDIPTLVQGLAAAVIYYDNFAELKDRLLEYFPR